MSIPFIYTILGLIMMLALANILARKKVFFSLEAPGTYGGLDSLRGYAASLVAFHHAYIWYFYKTTGKWEEPNSRGFSLLGQGSVWIFFMITAFLFFGKLLDAKKVGQIDWVKLFCSRFLRIAPLYYFVTAIIFFLVWSTSKEIRLDTLHQISPYIRWMALGALGAPDINGLEARRFVAGVTWTLAYEWTFYFSLPVLAAALLIHVKRSLLAASMVVTTYLLISHHNFYSYIAFFLGGVAAVWIRDGRGISYLKTNLSKWVLIAISIAILATPRIHELLDLIALFLIFSSVCAGNSFFGIFKSISSRYLGQISYSIYLTHGLILYFFNTQFPTNSLQNHWQVTVAATTGLVVTSSITYLFFEKPFMTKSHQTSVALKALVNRIAQARR